MDVRRKKPHAKFGRTRSGPLAKEPDGGDPLGVLGSLAQNSGGEHSGVFRLVSGCEGCCVCVCMPDQSDVG